MSDDDDEKAKAPAKKVYTVQGPPVSLSPLLLLSLSLAIAVSEALEHTPAGQEHG